MKLTYHGHSCFTVEAAGKRLLFDPFITHNPLGNGEKDTDQIEADYIFLSHGHEDHTADAASIAKRTGAQLIAMVEVAGWMGKQGVENTMGMNYGSTQVAGLGRVSMVAALHSSSMPDGSYGGNPAGFVVQTDEGAFYYAGDTALTLEMQLVPRYAPCDFAVMPIGGHFTMDAQDAAEAAILAGVKRVAGVHYDTWPPIAINKEQAMQAFRSKGLELLLPGIGETIEL